MKQKEMRGKVKKLTGRAKQAAGIITGDKALERKGAQQRSEGTVQENVSKARRKAGEFVERVGKAIKK